MQKSTFLKIKRFYLNIDNPYFAQMVGQIYPTELQLNMANFQPNFMINFNFEIVIFSIS